MNIACLYWASNILVDATENWKIVDCWATRFQDCFPAVFKFYYLHFLLWHMGKFLNWGLNCEPEQKPMNFNIPPFLHKWSILIGQKWQVPSVLQKWGQPNENKSIEPKRLSSPRSHNTRIFSQSSRISNFLTQWCFSLQSDIKRGFNFSRNANELKQTSPKTYGKLSDILITA